MLFSGKIDDIVTSFTPRLMQDEPILIIPSVSFSVFILLFLWLFISLEPICSKTTSSSSSWDVDGIQWYNLLGEAPRKTLNFVFFCVNQFLKGIAFYSI